VLSESAEKAVLPQARFRYFTILFEDDKISLLINNNYDFD